MNKSIFLSYPLLVLMCLLGHYCEAQVPIFYSPTYTISPSSITPQLTPHKSTGFFDVDIQINLNEDDVVPAGLTLPLQNSFFDGEKYTRIADHLKKTFAFDRFQEPPPITEDNVKDILIRYAESRHQPIAEILGYYDELKSSHGIAQGLDVPTLNSVAFEVLHRNVITPMLAATSGTIAACREALATGWALNLGGGYHHATANRGGGFCLFPDIAVAIILLWQQQPHLKVLIVDLDAHQGNGLETIFTGEERVAFFDMYNRTAYPYDWPTSMITFNHPLEPGTTTEAYLHILTSNLPQAIDRFKPELIVFNAGSDPLQGDTFGRLEVSAQGLIKRDQFVFEQAALNKIPIAMTLSGGYTPQSVDVVKQSLTTFLLRKGFRRNAKHCTIL